MMAPTQLPLSGMKLLRENPKLPPLFCMAAEGSCGRLGAGILHWADGREGEEKKQAGLGREATHP